jgi:tRNA(fMet)-specific endonuclease VapC
MKKILLDTNAYVSYLGGDHAVLDALAEAEIVYFSIFVLGELYAGFRRGSREIENYRILRKFIQKPSVTVLEAGNETAEIFGKVKNDLKVAGTPLPINDVWIAAHAVETGSVIVTYDAHFLKIPGIRVWHGLSSYERGDPHPGEPR